ncbi:MAG: hypothetical protein ACI8ZM_002931 [Crocinitomix sp.]|jgi:hypothetical protein
MKNSIFRSVLMGLLVGVLFFVAFRLVLVLLIVGAIFKLAGGGKWKREQWRERKLAYVDNVRNMDENQYEQFKSDFGQGHCHNYNSKR